MNKEVKIKDLGLIEYKKAWDYQEELLSKIVKVKIKNRNEGSNDSTKYYLIFVDHPHLYTLGKSGDISNLLIDHNELKRNHTKFYKINRGGDITYHGPGQIVGYPILDLDNFFTDIHKYLRFLEPVWPKITPRSGIMGPRGAENGSKSQQNQCFQITICCGYKKVIH